MVGVKTTPTHPTSPENKGTPSVFHPFLVGDDEKFSKLSISCFFFDNFAESNKIRIFATDSVSSVMGWWVKTYWKKDVYERYLLRARSRKSNVLEDSNKNVRIGCIVTCSLFEHLQYISAWAIELLILTQGNARARHVG